MADEETLDKLEVKLRRWRAEEGLIELVRECVPRFDLDPALEEDLVEACREQDFDATLEALGDFAEALREAS
jgi:hypothetical protein